MALFQCKVIKTNTISKLLNLSVLFQFFLQFMKTVFIKEILQHKKEGIFEPYKLRQTQPILSPPHKCIAP